MEKEKEVIQLLSNLLEVVTHYQLVIKSLYNILIATLPYVENDLIREGAKKELDKYVEKLVEVEMITARIKENCWRLDPSVKFNKEIIH